MKELVFILVGSRKRVGKDTVATLLHDKLAASGRSVAKTSFAYALKREMQKMFNDIGASDFDAFTEDAFQKENIVRPMLIAWGMARRAVNPNYWIERVIAFANTGAGLTLFNTVGQFKSDPHRFVVVSDWRFPNELEHLREQGYVVRGIDIRRDSQPNEIPEEIKNSPLCAALSTTTIPNLSDLETLSRVCDGVVAELNRIYPNHE